MARRQMMAWDAIPSRALADAIAVVHFAYVMFVIFGLVLTLLGAVRKWDWVRNRWFRGIHLAMILIVVLESWVGITCPLTIWEQNLRLESGQQADQGDFIAGWVHSVIFVEAPPWVLTAGYTLFGVLVLAALWIVPPRWKRPVAEDME